MTDLAASSDYPLLNVFWTMLFFFLWIMWIWLLIVVFTDLFRRHDIGGWGKAGWTLVLILIPFLSVLVYLIVEGKPMAERRQRDVAASQSQFEDYVKSVSAKSDPAEQISKGKELLDKGAISPEEFETIKRHALAA